MVVTGYGESGFDSGEGVWETATTSKEGSRRLVNVIVPCQPSIKVYSREFRAVDFFYYGICYHHGKATLRVYRPLSKIDDIGFRCLLVSGTLPHAVCGAGYPSKKISTDFGTAFQNVADTGQAEYRVVRHGVRPFFMKKLSFLRPNFASM
ncbi:hypothetical protein J6590_102060 [Homalodisca vitripennis]|nr:hypothetical protein J6590_102060 [Homalodisca vitripennis]